MIANSCFKITTYSLSNSEGINVLAVYVVPGRALYIWEIVPGAWIETLPYESCQAQVIIKLTALRYNCIYWAVRNGPSPQNYIRTKSTMKTLYHVYN